MTFIERVKSFSREADPKVCTCKQERNGTGVFYNSVDIIYCVTCHGWQDMKAPIK